MSLRLHQRALEEIRETAKWYHARGQGLSGRFLADVHAALEKIEVQPSAGSKLETMPPDETFRRLLLKGFPYLIVFEAIGNDVFVYAVAHASRQPNYWRRRTRRKS